MKTIGLIGGMSWESTQTYYQEINETVKERLGGFHSGKILLYSVDFSEIEGYQSENDWKASANILSSAAQTLENAGADFIVICTNTMHKVAPEIAQAVKIPLLHIADATLEELYYAKIKRVGLLGTKYTMVDNFYKDKIAEKGIEVITPDQANIEIINYIIYEELCQGIISSAAKKKLIEVINRLQSQGAEGIILGCTEIGMLIKQKDVNIPVFDTTLIHAKKAALLSINL